MPDKDGDDDQDLDRADHSLHDEAGNHDDSVDLEDPFCCVFIEKDKNHDEEQPRHLPEELGNALIELGHSGHLRQVIVKDSFIQSVPQGEGRDGQEERPVTRFWPEDVC